MSAYHDRLDLQVAIKELIDRFQATHDLRVSEVNLEDNGFSNGRPCGSTVSVETEEQ